MPKYSRKKSVENQAQLCRPNEQRKYLVRNNVCKNQAEFLEVRIFILGLQYKFALNQAVFVLIQSK